MTEWAQDFLEWQKGAQALDLGQKRTKEVAGKKAKGM